MGDEEETRELDAGFVHEREECELPAAFARRTALAPDDVVEEDGWECPICPLTDESANPEHRSPTIVAFREALSSQPRVLPETDACRVLSAMFNRTCYAANMRMPASERLNVRKISPRDVQLHLEHARHLRENEDQMVDDRIWYALRVAEHLERNGLWTRGVEGVAQLDRNVFSDWCKAQDVLNKLVALRQKVPAPAAPSGSATNRKKRRSHYARR